MQDSPSEASCDVDQAKDHRSRNPARSLAAPPACTGCGTLGQGAGYSGAPRDSVSFGVIGRTEHGNPAIGLLDPPLHKKPPGGLLIVAPLDRALQLPVTVAGCRSL